MWRKNGDIINYVILIDHIDLKLCNTVSSFHNCAKQNDYTLNECNIIRIINRAT